MSDESPPPVPISPQPERTEIVAAETVLARFFSERVGPTTSPIDQAMGRKMTADHITKLIEFNSLKEKNRHTEATESRRLQPVMGAMVVFALLTFVFCFAWLAFHYGKSEVVIPVVTGLCGLTAGAIGGYGVGKGRTGDRSEHPSS